MKSQVSFVEFIATFLIFITFVAYYSLQLSNFVPRYIGLLEKEVKNSACFQISEILLKDKGEPENWEETPLSVERIGLSSGKKLYLSYEKIEAMQSLCDDNYTFVVESLGSEHNFSVTIIRKTDGSVILHCYPTHGSPSSSIRRFSSCGGEECEVIIQIY